MRISIFGMGYVGAVSGACLLRDGHEIVGVNPVSAKVADLADIRGVDRNTDGYEGIYW